MEESLLFDENSPQNVALPDVEEAVSIKAGSFRQTLLPNKEEEHQNLSRQALSECRQLHKAFDNRSLPLKIIALMIIIGCPLSKLFFSYNQPKRHNFNTFGPSLGCIISLNDIILMRLG